MALRPMYSLGPASGRDLWAPANERGGATLTAGRRGAVTGARASGARGPVSRRSAPGGSGGLGLAVRGRVSVSAPSPCRGAHCPTGRPALRGGRRRWEAEPSPPHAPDVNPHPRPRRPSTPSPRLRGPPAVRPDPTPVSPRPPVPTPVTLEPPASLVPNPNPALCRPSAAALLPRRRPARRLSSRGSPAPMSSDTDAPNLDGRSPRACPTLQPPPRVCRAGCCLCPRGGGP